MSNWWVLTKVLLKTNLLLGSGDGKKRKKSMGIVGFALLIIFVMCCLGIPIIFAINSVLEIMPIHSIILSFVFPLAGITTVVFGIFSIVSVFYLNKDSDYLIPLPIRSRDILLSKFFVAMVNEYYVLFMFILPSLIGVGIGVDAGILYYVYTILIFLLLPIIPSVIMTFLILIITKFSGVLKNKDLFMYVSMGLILFFALGYNYIVQNFIGLDVNNIGVAIGELENSVLPYIKFMFPFYNSAVNALINYKDINGLFSLITFIGFNLMSLLILYFSCDQLYLKTLITNSGSKKKTDNVQEMNDNRFVKKSNVYLWLLKKEWLIIKRTPIFMLNIVIIIFIMPIVVVVSFLITMPKGENSLFSSIDTFQLKQFISDPMVFLIVLVVGLFFTSTSIAAATSISREGNSAWHMKVIPVSYFKQVSIKVAFAVILDMIGVVIIGAVPVIMYKIPLYYVLCLFIPLLILIVLINYFNIYLDLKHPKIKWNEESVAVKQNLNSMISIFMTIAISCIFGIVAFVFYKYDIYMNVVLLSVIISLVSGIILWLVIYCFYKKSDKLLDNVE